MPKGFPTCSYRKILKIVKRHADGPLNKTGGSHQKYRSKITGKVFVFPVRKKDFGTNLVRKILVKDLGLSEEQALKEVR